MSLNVKDLIKKLERSGVGFVKNIEETYVWIYNKSLYRVFCLTDGLTKGTVSISNDISLTNGRLLLDVIDPSVENEQILQDIITTEQKYFVGLSPCSDDCHITLWSNFDEFIDRMTQISSFRHHLIVVKAGQKNTDECDKYELG